MKKSFDEDKKTKKKSFISRLLRRIFSRKEKKSGSSYPLR